MSEFFDGDEPEITSFVGANKWTEYCVRSGDCFGTYDAKGEAMLVTQASNATNFAGFLQAKRLQQALERKGHTEAKVYECTKILLVREV